MRQLTVDAPRRQLLVTGEFSRLGGAPREYLGAVGIGTARATRFAPRPDANSHGDSVFGTVSANGAVYAFGYFSQIGGLPRDAFARLDPVTGRAMPTAVSPICPTALAAAGTRLYAGTNPSCESSQGPLRALALPALQPVAAWRPQLSHGYVQALGTGRKLVVAATTAGHFAPAPRTITGLDEHGRRVFSSPFHQLRAVQALTVSGDLVVVGGV